MRLSTIYWEFSLFRKFKAREGFGFCVTFLNIFFYILKETEFFYFLTTFNILAPPGPPENLQVKDITSKTCTLQWEPPTNDGGTDITGYVIEKKLESVTKWEKVVTLEHFTLTFTIENLKEKSDYLFRVFAENAVGLGIPANTGVINLKTSASKYIFDFFLNHLKHLNSV